MVDGLAGPDYTAHLETNDQHRTFLVLCPGAPGTQTAPPSRYAANHQAASWALSLDVQYADQLRAGKPVRIAIPRGLGWSVGRPRREALGAYRALRLSVGALIWPLLRKAPDLDELYPFQREGVAWLLSRSGGILADDMGLGKTVQVITAIRLLFHRAQIRSAVVACPKTLISTWERELSRWAPELGVAVITPTARLREQAWNILSGRRHVLLTTYEQFREVPTVLQQRPPDLFVADEAHRLRNPDAQTTSGALLLRPQRFWAVTGTPVERDLKDLTTLLSFVAADRFAPTDAKYHPTIVRSLARPFVLRRRKRDVLKQLPAVYESTERIELTDEQAVAYRSEVEQHRRQGRPGDELALLTRLQAICDIDTNTGASSKADRVLSLLAEIRGQCEKAVVFSYRIAALRELAGRISSRWDSGSGVLLLGEMTREERDRAVVRFRRDKDIFVLLASARIGGEGLTLVEANHVFLFNRWWNPSANDQARDRVVRIGQRRPVRVYQFCCSGTIEEAIERILQAKKSLVADTVERLAESETGAWALALREVGLSALLGTLTKSPSSASQSRLHTAADTDRKPPKSARS